MDGKAKSIHWIDTIKAICMISVYLVHSEVYYGTGGIEYGYVLKPFYVSAFMFVSGYIFFWKHFDNNIFSGGKRVIQNMVFRLIIPTIIFSSVIYVPKILFHDNELSICRYLVDVFGGISYWFTSSLVVAQLSLLAILVLIKRKNIWFYVGITLLLFVAGWALAYIDNTPFPWYYKSGMGATLLMALGGAYQKYEQKVDKRIGITGLVAVALAYIVLMGYDFEKHTALFILYSMKWNILGVITTILGIILILQITKRMPEFKIMSFIGRNSIIFYFLSGVTPAAIGILFQKIFPDEKNYLITMLVTVTSLCISYVATVVINKYFPFLIDLRKLRK